ncbi:DNA-binding transcriptional regulator, LysR family [Amphritea atlantica]|uniref:DNA-binding transcriptional regulator, LysR family n=1 Tax=Amphritea atlantica TaxID=355243 RepID=A0A1H9IGT5_9GAMM|nr:LysR family transcriptional regulator [Amphritea atlantica]SEQ73931.1 DNA-binding transcriptional regulator, LysR family [Amphritea atlantica]
MNTSLSIRHLRAFTEVACCGSFTQAASRLHLTQSSLTATVKQLEQSVGLTLFDRTTRRVLLTAQGEQFRPVAEKLISDFDTAIGDLQAIAGQQQGQVGIAASPSTISRLLPPVIDDYRQQFPEIAISLRDDSAGQIEQRVLDNDVDFGIGANHSANPELYYQPVLTDRYGVVVPEGHRFEGFESVQWQALIEEELLFLSADTGIRAQLNQFRQAGQLQLSDQKAILEVSNPAGIAALIRQRIGISVLPALASSTESFKALHFIPLVEPQMRREICLVSRKGRSLSPAASTLLSFVRQHFLTMRLPAYLESTAQPQHSNQDL